MTTPLLLDEMLSPVIASRLVERGHDVTAVVTDPALVSLADPDILAAAGDQGRALVTANIGDFVRLDVAWRQDQRTHRGIVLLPNSSFPRDDAFVGAVVTALDACLASDLVRPGELHFLRRT